MMNYTAQNLRLIDSTGKLHSAVLKRWDESPDDVDEVMIEVTFGDTVIRSVSERGYFQAFCDVRRQLESLDLMPLCFAACENVYPSPMSESMGYAEKAYALTLGKQARTSDLVEIFDTFEGLAPVSVERQQRFYEFWIKSLGRK